MPFLPAPASRMRRALRRLAAAALLVVAAPAALGYVDVEARAAAAPGASAAPALPSATAPATVPRPIEGPSFAPMGVSLLVVLALMAAVLWALRRAGLAPRPGTPGLLRVVGQLSLGPRERVVIVEAGERWLLLGVGAGGISRLASLSKSELPATAAMPASFGSLLERLRKGGA
jgi:flagellar protein FliO/FliZ